MNLKYFVLINLGILFSIHANAMPDLLRLDEERVVYWQEKKLGRALSEYEKKQLLNISTQIGPIYTAYKHNKKLTDCLKKITTYSFLAQGCV